MSASVCGVAHLRLLEQPHDGIAVVASGFQMRFHARPKRLLVGRPCLFRHCRLQVAVEVFVWIQLGGIAREVEQPHLTLAFLQLCIYS